MAEFRRRSGDTVALLMSAFQADTSMHKEYAFLASSLRSSTVLSSACYSDRCRYAYELLPSWQEPDGRLAWHLSAAVLGELRRPSFEWRAAMTAPR